MVAPVIAAILPSLIDWIGKAVSKAIPDPEKAAEVMLEVRKMEQTGELAYLASETSIAEAQAEINKIEAGAADLFRSGWRPAVGWICALGLSYQFIARPTMNFILALFGYNVEMGALELETLMTLLFGMLGLGWYRTQEKVSGVSR